MVGKSTCGSGDTGSWKNATAPAKVMPRVSSVVATGRRMKDSDTFIATRSWCRALFAFPRFILAGEVARQTITQAREGKIDHRRRKQCQHLTDDQAADDREPERMAQLRPRPRAERQWQRTEERRHRGHQDRAQTQQAGLVDGLARCLALLALGIEREVDHQDRVLLDDADQQDNADNRDDSEIAAGDDQRKQRADPRRGQSREDGYGMNEALVKNSEHDIDDDHRREDKEEFVAERTLEGEGGTLEVGDDALREPNVLLGLIDHGDRLAERYPWSQVKRDRGRRKLPEVVDQQRRRLLVDMSDRRERHLPIARGRRGQVDRTQRSQRILQRGVGLENDAVLIRLGIDGRDDTLAE